MARLRVFRTRVNRTDTSSELISTCDPRHMIGREVTLEKLSSSEANIKLDGAVVAQLDGMIGPQVALAIDRGQSFKATIEHAFPIYDDRFKPTRAHLDIKVEYLLDKGQPAIEVARSGRCVERPQPDVVRSFFSKVAGVTFEGRQRIVSRCAVGERLTLVRDPNNPFDQGAIKVMRLNGEQLGFIAAHVSRNGDSSGLAFRMDQGNKYQCRISDLTGGGDRSLGVNIGITEAVEFDTIQTRSLTSVAPRVHSNLGRFFLSAAVALVVLIALIVLSTHI